MVSRQTPVAWAWNRVGEFVSKDESNMVFCTDTDNSTTEYVSCDRTQEDEHSLFVRFQCFCLLLGIFSYVWVRRYRSLFATLFDQRKVSGTRRPSDGDNRAGAIEMASREEVSPLTGNSNLEIV
jgi:hypothetical protein